MHHLPNPYKVIDEFTRVLSFEGKIVISDFTQEGFAIIEKVHAAEGRIHKSHKVKKNLFEEIGTYLSRKGFKIEKHQSRLQQLLIA